MGKESAPKELLERLLAAKKVTVLTGAGMSAESGVPTFRDAAQGLWARFDPTELATPQAWKSDRTRIWAWYEWRRGLVEKAQPHAAHFAITSLAKILEQVTGREVTVALITQNVDNLHEKAGFTGALHVHGSLFAPRCNACGRPGRFNADPPQQPVDRIAPPTCEHCGGYLRPGAVWFEEPLPQLLWQEAVQHVEACDVLLVVGTFGIVHPVAALPKMAGDSGAWVCEVNPEQTGVSEVAQLVWRTTAAVGLPDLLDSLQFSGSREGGS